MYALFSYSQHTFLLVPSSKNGDLELHLKILRCKKFCSYLLLFSYWTAEVPTLASSPEAGKGGLLFVFAAFSERILSCLLHYFGRIFYIIFFWGCVVGFSFIVHLSFFCAVGRLVT